MNGGAKIPGYYWDEEKKKYFKIQANHLLPVGAKYSKSNVRVEERKAKKQKLEQSKKIYLEKRTVKRSPILQHAVTGGIGLRREHGNTKPSQSLAQSDTALISQLRPQFIRTPFPLCTSCEGELVLIESCYIPSTKQMLLGTMHTQGQTASIQCCQQWDWDGTDTSKGGSSALMALCNGLISLDYNETTQRVIACGRKRQLFIGSLPSTSADQDTRAHGVFLNVAQRDDCITAASFNQTSGLTAVSTSTRLFTVNAMANITSPLSISPPQDQRKIDWLDPNVLAFGGSSIDSTDKVRLWDVRTEHGVGVSYRFTVKGRITGILGETSCGGAGSQLLVATNYAIKLFDTRMPSIDDLQVTQYDNPLLSFPHVHGGGQLEYATDGKRGLVAAVDRDNVVQVYSIRTASNVGSLASPMAQSGTGAMLKSLRWLDDDRDGLTLMGLRGDGVVRWRWGGTGDEG